MTSQMDLNESHPVNRSVILVSSNRCLNLSSSKITTERVGIKAYGLLQLPEPWVPRFFVVSGKEKPSQDAINRAAKKCGISDLATVYVRSSGTKEGIEERGSLDSWTCSLVEASQYIKRLAASPHIRAQKRIQTVHFIVQERVPSPEKGHLSNERRLSRHPRDWTVEFEKDGGMEPLGVRHWRDASTPSLSPLSCDSHPRITRALRAVASWAHPHRAHFEWIWDGTNVWVVQLDFLTQESIGVSPKALVSQSKRAPIDDSTLKHFGSAKQEHFASYRKLANARMYQELGYSMPTFFVMNDKKIMQSVIKNGVVPTSLKDDLETLCSRPFVLRTDATDLQPGEREMLPRSDELRSADAAVQWLTTSFRSAMLKLESARNIVLIGHHFIPATASAWAQALPNKRRVRIEALWGIPEGLYYFAHDVYDVDTGVIDVSKGSRTKCKVILKRERYKGKFIAPSEEGDWIVHHTDEDSDWTGSITKQSWVQEIAWTTRLIAAKAGHPVVVMWFIDLPDGHSKHQVLPWFHDKWERPSDGYKSALQRKKRQSSQFRKITNRASWIQLQNDLADGVKVERVFISPEDSEIVRDRDFVLALAEHSKQHDYVVELSGGLLSHVFYILSKARCNVELVDLVGIKEEQIEYNKIVRDKIPEDIKSRGEQVEVVHLTGNALIEALKDKLLEEAFEVLDARTADSIVEEVADLKEVIDALLHALDIEPREVLRTQEKKRVKRGGFKEALMLIRTSLPPTLAEDLIEETGEPPRNIAQQEQLPRPESDFHIDHRIDITGSPERQITLTMPAYINEYAAGNHRFDLATQSGEKHDLFFSATVTRAGSTLKLRLRLTNSPVQLTLFPEEATPSGLDGVDTGSPHTLPRHRKRKKS